MRIRPKDFIVIDDKLFFAVVNQFQEDNHALTFLRYIKDNTSIRKLTTKEADEIITKYYPEFQFSSTYTDIKLHGVPISMVKKIYYPGENKAERFKINSNKEINIPANILAEINLLNKS